MSVGISEVSDGFVWAFVFFRFMGDYYYCMVRSLLRSKIAEL